MPRLISRETLAPMIGAAFVTVLAMAAGMGGIWLVGAAAVGSLVGALTVRQSKLDEPAELVRDPVLDTEPFAPQPVVMPISEGRLSTVLEALPIGVMVSGTDQMVVAANESMRQIFGLPDEPGYPVETLRARLMLEAITKVQASGNPSTFEMTLSRGSDAMLQVHIQPAPDDAPQGISLIIAVEDITKARLADEVHRDFVANASHELKTPLAVVSGLIETLQGPAKNDPVGTERFLKRLASQTQRMTGLINDLMSLNRIELNERVLPQAPQDLTALVAETVDALRPVAEASDVELILYPIDQIASVLADREELSQLFGNLIDNAIKYGGIGKQVHVKFSRSLDDQQIGVMVTDQGPGIPREHIPRLTERFYRVDIGRSREQGGTGLGLAICKHIVNRHRGRLEIESRMGEGSQFTVWLPSRFSDNKPGNQDVIPA